MMTLRRIGVFSAARVGFLFGVATGLVHLIIGITMFILGGGSLGEIPMEVWRLVAFSIFMSSLVLAAVVLMFAFLYNLSPGGLKLEFDTPGSSAEKRKNDEFDDDIEEIE